MIGVELVRDGDPAKPAPEETRALVDGLLRDGFLVLPCGPGHNVLTITPPFVITEEQLDCFLDVLGKCLRCQNPEIPARRAGGRQTGAGADEFFPQPACDRVG